mmetsp:Transcript_71207/g.159376  ORF Transcript_71207/g.159376 Transcript_71207/m.159376 type:complete len:225 (-) Transcript_71207:96-770(-)
MFSWSGGALGQQGTQVYSPEVGGMTESEPVRHAGCGACLRENGTKALVWKFVGEGQGSFSPLQSYEYVGQGRGTHEKNVVVTPGRINLYKVLICVAFPICVLLAAAGIYWAVVLARDGDQSAARFANFDCSTGMEQWQEAERDWCCANKGMGCGAARIAQACQQMCTFGGHTASCADRVQWGATHRFAADPNGCTSAYDMVIGQGQCSLCRSCPLAGTNCVHPR